MPRMPIELVFPMITDQLRTRDARHSDCETLAHSGGFRDRPLDTLKTDLAKKKKQLADFGDFRHKS